MSRFLFTTIAQPGHINPTIGVVQWLLHGGHQVAWCCNVDAPELRAQAEMLGLEFIPGAEYVASAAQGDFLNRDWRMQVRKEHLAALPQRVDVYRERIKGFRPDVVIGEGPLYDWIIATELEKVPYANIESALVLAGPPDFDCDFFAEYREIEKERAAHFARYKVERSTRYHYAVSPWLNTIFATEAFLPGVKLPPKTHLLGPSFPMGGMRGDEDAFDWGRLDAKRPVVYVSIGSLLSDVKEGLVLTRRIAEAATSLGAQVVVTAGEAAEHVKDMPPGTIVEPFVPQPELLKRTHVFVTHGGANSVTEAMACGVPLLVFPFMAEQPLQAHFVVKAGVGFTHDAATVSGETLKTSLTKLLAPEGPERKAAARVAEDYKKRDGARAAADLLVDLAAKK
jgi:MGT family glycosyltransferase